MCLFVHLSACTCCQTSTSRTRTYIFIISTKPHTHTHTHTQHVDHTCVIYACPVGSLWDDGYGQVRGQYPHVQFMREGEGEGRGGMGFADALLRALHGAQAQAQAQARPSCITFCVDDLLFISDFSLLPLAQVRMYACIACIDMHTHTYAHTSD